jgi:hypothetical protein
MEVRLMDAADGPYVDDQLAGVRREIQLAGSAEAVDLALLKARALAELGAGARPPAADTRGQ